MFIFQDVSQANESNQTKTLKKIVFKVNRKPPNAAESDEDSALPYGISNQKKRIELGLTKTQIPQNKDLMVDIEIDGDIKSDLCISQIFTPSFRLQANEAKFGPSGQIIPERSRSLQLGFFFNEVNNEQYDCEVIFNDNLFTNDDDTMKTLKRRISTIIEVKKINCQCIDEEIILDGNMDTDYDPDNAAILEENDDMIDNEEGTSRASINDKLQHPESDREEVLHSDGLGDDEGDEIEVDRYAGLDPLDDEVEDMIADDNLLDEVETEEGVRYQISFRDYLLKDKYSKEEREKLEQID